MVVYYPLFINLHGKKVLIFGGGDVALRKAKSLIKAGAKLSVISRDYSAPFIRFAKHNEIRLKKGSLVPSLKPFALVISATSDDSFNRKVAQICDRKRILINMVDDPRKSSFIVPSVVQRGNLQVAISTGGASPFLAKMLRKKLEREFNSKYQKLVSILSRERLRIKKTFKSQKKRNLNFRKLVRFHLGKISRSK